MILRPDWKQWQKWPQQQSQTLESQPASEAPFVGQVNWRHLADGPRGNSSGENKGQTRRGRQRRFRPSGFIARSRARVFEATHSTRVHASGVSHGTERTRVSFLESRRYNTESIEVHYPLFRETQAVKDRLSCETSCNISDWTKL